MNSFHRIRSVYCQVYETNLMLFVLGKGMKYMLLAFYG